MSRLIAPALLLALTLTTAAPGRADAVFMIDGRPVDVVDVTRRTVIDLDDPDAVVTMPAPPLPATVPPTVEDESGRSRPAAPPRPTSTPAPATARPRPVSDASPWIPRAVLGLLLAGVVLVLGRVALDGRRRRPSQAPVN